MSLVLVEASAGVVRAAPIAHRPVTQGSQGCKVGATGAYKAH